MKSVVSQFVGKHEMLQFLIYPFVSGGGMMGSLAVGKGDWDRVVKKLAKSKCVEKEVKSYVYRDLEMSLEGNDNDYVVVHRNIVHVSGDDKHLLVIVNEKIVDNESFPKLNEYHEEVEKRIKLYRFGSVSLSLVTGEGGSSVEMRFQYREKNLENIMKDLTFVFDILGD
ncbi:MAG: hypothetical protein Hyperionvirus20_17 [Hyperionvirus sp.]|uniref:Uncharacterized protein n=1 Tax=Hyperionvirus sp. TaxID=2487770 RepID=A0A3G5AFT1_9VIRU|nr:MAG: hypothetical protein Hyperionvirus20_17 [Hyperionvirus sp.]